MCECNVCVTYIPSANTHAKHAYKHSYNIVTYLCTTYIHMHKNMHTLNIPAKYTYKHAYRSYERAYNMLVYKIHAYVS